MNIIKVYFVSDGTGLSTEQLGKSILIQFPDINFRYKTIPFVNSLKKASNQDGKPFTIIPLPMPSAIKYENFRLPASYANFYIGNRTVLVPAFNDPCDEVAEDILKMCFPNRRIVRIDSRILIKGQGGVHCITQQQPASFTRGVST